MNRSEEVIRAALAAEADQAVDSGVVLARLRGAPRRTRGGLVALVGVAVTAAVAAVVVPLVAGRSLPDVVPAAPPPMNVLVIGTDGQARADTVVLARIADGRVSVLSLPRDSWVDIPGHGMGRLSSAYTAGGSEGVAAVVEALTGQPVDHYAAVDMTGFERLATAVGGVEVCLRSATSDRYSGADFPAGRQSVSGADALAFLRQRHGLPNGDLDRVARQQVFLRALAGKLARTVLTDPAARDALTAQVRATVRTDSGWNPIAVAATATGPVRLATIPITGAAGVVAVDPARVRSFTADFFADGASAPATSRPGSAPSDGCVN